MAKRRRKRHKGRQKTGERSTLALPLYLIGGSAFIILVWNFLGSGIVPPKVESTVTGNKSVHGLATRWLDRVDAAQSMEAKELERAQGALRALRIAMLLIASPQDPSPRNYVDLFKSEGLAKPYFQQPFLYWDPKKGSSQQRTPDRINRPDARLWVQALFFHKLAHQLAPVRRPATETDATASDAKTPAATNEERLQKLYKAVVNGFKDVKPSPYENWPDVLIRPERRAWVLSELAYQAGWETALVSFRYGRTQRELHTACELRKGRAVWFADPAHGILLKGVSARALSQDAPRVAKLWPDRADLQAGLRNTKLLIPSMPQDYRFHNQRLHARVAAVLSPGECPRFGTDPNARKETYHRLRGTEPGKPLPLSLWMYPVRLLVGQMRRAQRAAAKPPRPGASTRRMPAP